MDTIGIVLDPIIKMFVVIILYASWSLLWSFMHNERVEFVFSIMICMFGFSYYGCRYTFYTRTVLTLLHILVAVMVVWLIHYVELKVIDYAMLTGMALALYRIGAGYSFGNSILMLGVWLLLCIVVRRRVGKISKVTVQTLISMVCFAIVYYLFDILLNPSVLDFYYKTTWKYRVDRFAKGCILLLLSLFVLFILGLIILAMKKILNYYFERCEHFSQKYEEISQYLIFIPYLFCFMLFAIGLIKDSTIWPGTGMLTFGLVLCVIMFVLLQVYSLVLLVKTIRIKEHLEFRESESENLKLYNEDVKKNMIEIREMKHDLKNIFLTMGEYIRRSEDEELKEYYYDKIAPYAKNEVKMNDLYVRLQELGNESLKAFLYYKIMQGMDYKIDMRFETNLDHSVMSYIADVSTITRILGIFIDNAMEESLQVGKGSFVEISICEKEGRVSITVKNQVRDVVKKTGIRMGVSQKGLGRGNGLVIVDKLIKKNRNLVWNSYFKESVYGQTLLIMRP